MHLVLARRTRLAKMSLSLVSFILSILFLSQQLVECVVSAHTSTLAASSDAASAAGNVDSIRARIMAATDGDPSLLAFSRIYIINLKKRADRRKHMLSLAEALDVEFEFVEATTTTDPVVNFILDRLIDEQVDATARSIPPYDLPEDRSWPGQTTW